MQILLENLDFKLVFQIVSITLVITFLVTEKASTQFFKDKEYYFLVLILDLIIKNDPDNNNIENLLGNTENTLAHFYQQFKKDNKLVIQEPTAKERILYFLLSLGLIIFMFISAPAFPILVVILIALGTISILVKFISLFISNDSTKEKGTKTADDKKADHQNDNDYRDTKNYDIKTGPTLERTNMFLFGIYSLIIGLTYLILPSIVKIEIILELNFVFIGFLYFIIGIRQSLYTIVLQVRWKTTWKNHLFKLMTKASVDNNSELFLHAQSFYTYINSQPSLLLTYQIAIVTGVLSLINILLI
ncbi:MAG: hypothetical protein HeimC3_39630 [Candidatus Heimdallarchaeota archaeon LC_3]|nr:MAG: hypothetical protein HeimC3_39630 [Candidatus Heimdallarchaeota archaeon LC_3]